MTEKPVPLFFPFMGRRKVRKSGLKKREEKKEEREIPFLVVEVHHVSESRISGGAEGWGEN